MHPCTAYIYCAADVFLPCSIEVLLLLRRRLWWVY
jgi:hypothetical protein